MLLLRQPNGRIALLREVLPDCLPERQLKKTGSAGPHSHK